MTSSRSEPVSEKKKEISDQPKLTHALIAAALSGAAGSYAAFGFESVKKRQQTNQVLPNIIKLGAGQWLRESYRGSSAFLCSLVPTSMIQQTTNHVLESNRLANTPTAKIFEAGFSGALGGFASTLAENIILEQQMQKVGPRQAIINLVSGGYSHPFRGLTFVMGRECIFGLCYLKLANQAGEYAEKNVGGFSVMPAKIMVGAMGSLASHPLDTVATTMQKYKYPTAKEAVSHLIKEGGVGAFFKGAGARIGLFTTAMLVISETQEQVLNHLENRPSKP